MKVVAVVGLKKTGKTTLMSALIRSLCRYGRVGTIKNMQGHQVDRGDTRRHFESGADVVIGLGDAQITVIRGGSLSSALIELKMRGVDFALVEGFKTSNLPKIALGAIELENVIERLDISMIDEPVIEDLTRKVMALEDWPIETS